MKTSRIAFQIIQTKTIDKGFGESGQQEVATTYLGTQQKIWATRNDSLRIAGAPMLTYRILTKSSALYEMAGSDPDAVNHLKYARVHGIKYSIVSISQGPNSLDVVVELGGIMP